MKFFCIAQSSLRSTIRGRRCEDQSNGLMGRRATRQRTPMLA
jgi:hypothetical protein